MTEHMRDIGSLLVAYCDRSLSDEGRQWVEAQLATLPELRERLVAIEAVRAQLHGAFPPAPTALRSAQRDLLRAHALARHPRRSARRRWALAAAAGLVIGVGGIAAFSTQINAVREAARRAPQDAGQAPMRVATVNDLVATRNDVPENVVADQEQRADRKLEASQTDHAAQESGIPLSAPAAPAEKRIGRIVEAPTSTDRSQQVGQVDANYFSTPATPPATPPASAPAAQQGDLPLNEITLLVEDATNASSMPAKQRDLALNKAEPASALTAGSLNEQSASIEDLRVAGEGQAAASGRRYQDHANGRNGEVAKGTETVHDDTDLSGKVASLPGPSNKDQPMFRLRYAIAGKDADGDFAGAGAANFKDKKISARFTAGSEADDQTALQPPPPSSPDIPSAIQTSGGLVVDDVSAYSPWFRGLADGDGRGQAVGGLPFASNARRCDQLAAALPVGFCTDRQLLIAACASGCAAVDAAAGDAIKAIAPGAAQRSHGGETLGSALVAAARRSGLQAALVGGGLALRAGTAALDPTLLGGWSPSQFAMAFGAAPLARIARDPVMTFAPVDDTASFLQARAALRARRAAGSAHRRRRALHQCPRASLPACERCADLHLLRRRRAIPLRGRPAGEPHRAGGARHRHPRRCPG